MASDDKAADIAQATVTRVTRGKAGVFKPNPKYILAAFLSNVPILSSSRLAFAIPQWKYAMTAEFRALRDNDTWSIIPWSTDDNVINTKCAFKVKHKDDGSVER